MRHMLLAIIILTSVMFTFVQAQNEVARGASSDVPAAPTAGPVQDR